jgi:GNAT superfamily N-acetyltransferase
MSTASSIIVRLLEPTEWEIWRAIRLNALQTDAVAFGKAYEEECDLPDTFWQDFRNCGRYVFGAFKDDDLVGCVGMFGLTQTKLKHKAQLYSMYVDASVRSCGVGAKLIQAVVKQAKDIPGVMQVRIIFIP